MYKKKFKNKKNLYSMGYSEDEEILFMGIETQAQDGELDEKGEVDLKDELISGLEELENERKITNSQTK